MVRKRCVGHPAIRGLRLLRAPTETCRSEKVQRTCGRSAMLWVELLTRAIALCSVHAHIHARVYHKHKREPTGRWRMKPTIGYHRVPSEPEPESAKPLSRKCKGSALCSVYHRQCDSAVCFEFRSNSLGGTCRCWKSSYQQYDNIKFWLVFWVSTFPPSFINCNI